MAYARAEIDDQHAAVLSEQDLPEGCSSLPLTRLAR